MMSSSATPSEKEIRILIADDHPIVCQGLIAVFALGRRSESVWPCSRWGGSLRALQSNLPRHLIMDLRMPKKDGNEVVIELMFAKAGTGYYRVGLTQRKEEDLRCALAAGAKGYLSKGADPEQVCDTIREVFAGSLQYRMISPRNWWLDGAARTFRARLQILKANGSRQRAIGNRAVPLT